MFRLPVAPCGLLGRFLPRNRVRAGVRRFRRSLAVSGPALAPLAWCSFFALGLPFFLGRLRSSISPSFSVSPCLDLPVRLGPSPSSISLWCSQLALVSLTSARMRPDVATFRGPGDGRGGPRLEAAPAGIPREVDLMRLSSTGDPPAADRMAAIAPASASGRKPVLCHRLPANPDRLGLLTAGG